MNNLNLGKTNSIEKQLNDVTKKEKNIISLKTAFKLILLKKIYQQKRIMSKSRNINSW